MRHVTIFILCAGIGGFIAGFGAGWTLRDLASSGAPAPAAAAPPIAPDGSFIVPLPGGRHMAVRDGSAVRVKIHTKPTARTLVRQEDGTLKGGGMDTTSAEIAASFDQDGQELSIDQGIISRTGRMAISAKLWAGRGANIFLVIGLALIVGGILAFLWLKMRGLGIAMAAAGAVSICVGVLYEMAPWVLAIGGLAVIGVVIYVAVNLWRGQKTKERLSGNLASTKDTLTDVVESVEDAHQVAAANGHGEKGIIKDLKLAIASKRAKKPGPDEIGPIVQKRKGI